MRLVDYNILKTIMSDTWESICLALNDFKYYENITRSLNSKLHNDLQMAILKRDDFTAGQYMRLANMLDHRYSVYLFNKIN